MNNDEFYTLIPREKKPEPKIHVHFKKGSWKQHLYKLASRWRSSRLVEDFHFTKLENIVICKGKDPAIIFSSSRIKKSKLKKLADKYSDAYILINATDRMYMRISLKSYMKLMDVDKIAIDFRLRAYFDGEVEVMDVYHHEDVIDNINELARYINYHRQGIEGVYEIQACCCAYTDYEFKFKIVVTKRDGTVETYKGDMNAFMKAYDLYQF